MSFSKDQVTNSLRSFVARRDDLLHEEDTAFEHHLQRFVEFCQRDPLVASVLDPLQENTKVDVAAWWNEVISEQNQRGPKLSFPTDPNEELILRYQILLLTLDDLKHIFQFGFAFGKYKNSEGIALFRSLIIRPFVDELSVRLGEVGNLASPEERALQAIPLNRLPRATEVRIFLSHKSVDKPLVRRYYTALKELGFQPWLDDPDMPAGANLERSIFKGFEESCAAVFFITENFKDEKYLAAEVDYAVIQKRKKDKKFAIITLRYSNAAPVPDLLTPYIYKTVSNDLEGFYELLRALPIELGPIRWKAEVVE